MIASFTKRFRNVKDIMESQHRKLLMMKFIELDEDYQTLDDDEKNELHEEVYNRFITYMLIQGTNHNRTGKLDKDLANQYALGEDKYPDNMAEATSMIINYQNRVNNPNHPSVCRQQQRQQTTEEQ